MDYMQLYSFRFLFSLLVKKLSVVYATMSRGLVKIFRNFSCS